MTQLAFDFSARVPFADEQCETCGGPLPRRARYATVSRFCSYWCHLVEYGPDFYTLETITPWLESYRNRPRATA